MTNKDKILRYLECGLKVKSTDEDGELTIHGTLQTEDEIEWFIVDDGTGAETLFQPCFEDYTLTPIPFKPNYKPGDLVRILPIVREVDDYERWDEEAKNMVDSGTYEIERKSIGDYWIYNKNKSEQWLFPAWAVAPVFPDETDEKAEKIKELEVRMAEIQKEIDNLKK